jgi:hypothetical protein
MKLIPVWILILIFISAGIQAIYPNVDLISVLDAPWVQGLLVSMGLGGIPLSILKRVISGAKTVDLSNVNLTALMEEIKNREKVV